jgi:hypothetical protein
MMKLEWKMNGRAIRPDQIANELMKGVRREASTHIENAVKQVRCPVHGTHASNVRAIAGSGSNMNFRYEACCDELKAAIARCLQ